MVASCADSDSGSSPLIDAVGAEGYPRVVALVRGGADVTRGERKIAAILRSATRRPRR
jgi:hypothetical protein